MNYESRNKISFFLALFLFFICVKITLANVIISEIMYDLEGADSGREWMEVYNGGNEEVDLSVWKFYEAETNHKIKEFQGGIILPANGYAIIADNSDKFLIDWPGFSGVIFDSVFSLKNSGENLILRDSDLNDINFVFYDTELGAKGDGNSLQLEETSPSGARWVAAKPTPGEQNNVGGQEQGELQEGNGDVALGGESSESSARNLFSEFETEPQIYAYAGVNKTGVAGGDVVFVGEALGLKKKPLDGARYLWNFGDGATKEGKKVRHTYKYPSDYIVWLNVSSGAYSAGDKVLVKIVPNQLKISEANEEFIKLHNGLKTDLDISGWFLSLGNLVPKFRFSEGTFIGANSSLPISSSVSSMKVKEGGNVELLYPNGSTAFSYPADLTKNRSPEVVGESRGEASGTPSSGGSSQNQRSHVISGSSSQEEELREKVVPRGGDQQGDGRGSTLRSNSEDTQLANIISITDKSKPISIKWWIALVSLIGICGGATVKLNKENEVVKTTEDIVGEYINEIEEV